MPHRIPNLCNHRFLTSSILFCNRQLWKRCLVILRTSRNKVTVFIKPNIFLVKALSCCLSMRQKAVPLTKMVTSQYNFQSCYCVPFKQLNAHHWYIVPYSIYLASSGTTVSELFYDRNNSICVSSKSNSGRMWWMQFKCEQFIFFFDCRTGEQLLQK